MTILQGFTSNRSKRKFIKDPKWYELKYCANNSAGSSTRFMVANGVCQALGEKFGPNLAALTKKRLTGQYFSPRGNAPCV